MQDAIPLIQKMNDSEKAQLSYRIADYNRRYRLCEEDPDPVGPPELGKKWLLAQMARTPTVEDRLLAFMQELIRQWDYNDYEHLRSDSEDERLLAGACCQGWKDLNEFWSLARNKGWIETVEMPAMGRPVERVLVSLDLSARMYVESSEREQGRTWQCFVAMWFDDSMTEAYIKGFYPAIVNADYIPFRVDRDEFLGKVDDHIIAGIRKSRFLVADFTSALTSEVLPQAIARGGVYFEAGFALGLDLQIIFTCRQDMTGFLHFDTNHFNHLIWSNPEDLRKKLQVRIEATLGQGIAPQTDLPT